MSGQEGLGAPPEDVKDEDVPAAEEEAHGRHAERPGDLPARGWRDVGKRVAGQVKEDDLPLISGGVAFYAMLALFPASVAMVSLYGLLTEPSKVADDLRSVTRAIPADAAHLVVSQLRSVASSSSGKLGVGLVVGLVGAFWSASSGMRWMLTALSLAYDEEETRKFVKLRGLSLLLTLAALVGSVVVLGLLAAFPSLTRAVGIDGVAADVVSVLRWPVLAVVVVLGLAVLYRFGPDRDEPQWRWVTWGSAIATAIWLLASAGLSLYASIGGRASKAYGSLAGVVVLLLWLFLTAFSILLGAEVNAELERQVRTDTTVGEARPMGQRDAEAADTLGPAAR